VTAPGQEWSETFSPGSPGTGLGQYAIDPGTPAAASDSGTFVVTYYEFTSDANARGSCYAADSSARGGTQVSCPGSANIAAASDTLPTCRKTFLTIRRRFSARGAAFISRS
jgi:hypothetical protein